jgi:phenylacetate-CoA ligase
MGRIPAAACQGNRQRVKVNGSCGTFARSHVPYYHEQFRALGLSDAEISVRPLRALTELPLLDKSTLRGRVDDLRCDDLPLRDWYENASGGSTGEPVRFLQDRDYHLMSMAATSLFDDWSGYRQGEPKILLWGSERDLLVGRETLRHSLGQWLRNEYALNAFRMTESDMERFVATINHVRPTQVLAYVDAAYELARFIEKKKLAVHAPKAVMTSAGTLFPHMRETIKRVFRAPVFNRYGSREVGDLASQCDRHLGLHVNPYTHHVEILRADGSPCEAGETGEIVVTPLANRAMPLLRYRIGDMGALAAAPCTCGRHWPLLSEVSGRVTDVFRRGDGTPVSPVYFIHFIGVTHHTDLDFIEKYQLVQEEPELIKMMLIPKHASLQRHDLDDEQKAVLVGIVKQVMGPSCRLEVTIVDHIPPEPSGKFRYTKSNLKGEHACT